MRYDHLDMLPEMAFKPLGKRMTLEGGGGKKAKAPKAPDYMALAREQSQMQKDINRETLAANRVNQVTPYGNMQYTQTGTDQYGNPTYTATQTLSPEQQDIYGKQTGLYSDLLGSANAGLSNYQQALENPQIDTSALPQVGINAGEAYQDAIMRRLQPTLDREQAQLENRLVNQGIQPGSEAWGNAMFDLNQRQNDKLTSAVIGGFNTGLAANQNAFNQALTNQNLPLNTLNALRSGVQMQMPNYVNSAGMQSWQAPDLMGAAQNRFNAQMGNYNAGQASNANFMGGLMNLGGLIGSSSPGSLFGNIGSSIGSALGF